MDVDSQPELTENDIAVADVVQPLDALVIRYTIKGPDVSSLFRKMENPFQKSLCQMRTA